MDSDELLYLRSPLVHSKIWVKVTKAKSEFTKHFCYCTSVSYFNTVYSDKSKPRYQRSNLVKNVELSNMKNNVLRKI